MKRTISNSYKRLSFLMLIIILFVLSACSSASTPEMATGDIPGTEDEVPRITVEELWQKMESGADIIVIDVRKQADYEIGHIKEAVSGPGEKIYLGEWKPPKGKELILYCT